MRSVIDTNVWVSALLNPSGAPAQVLSALRLRKFELVISEPMLMELAAVLSRPRLVQRFGISPDSVRELITVLREAASLATVVGAVRVCRDPKDDMVIETAVNGRATILVSRDDDLMRSPEVITYLWERRIDVLSVRRFLVVLDEQPPFTSSASGPPTR